MNNPAEVAGYWQSALRACPTPECISIPIEAGSEQYLAWIRESVKRLRWRTS